MIISNAEREDVRIRDDIVHHRAAGKKMPPALGW